MFHFLLIPPSTCPLIPHSGNKGGQILCFIKKHLTYTRVCAYNKVSPIADRWYETITEGVVSFFMLDNNNYVGYIDYADWSNKLFIVGLYVGFQSANIKPHKVLQ